MEKILIGFYKYDNYLIKIYDKDIINPYIVYVPIIEKNKIKKFIYINENKIGYFIYTIYKNLLNQNNIYIKNKIEIYNSFLLWILKFKNINESNWRVLIKNMYKNNVIN
tara:strand:- start:1044 stop:1370 length:327 start_codon:yes stop_codon:yes gene_type:complete